MLESMCHGANLEHSIYEDSVDYRHFRRIEQWSVTYPMG